MTEKNRLLAVIQESGDGCDYMVGCGTLVVHQRDDENESDFIIRVKTEYTDMDGKTDTLSYKFYAARLVNIKPVKEVTRYEVEW